MWQNTAELRKEFRQIDKGIKKGGDPEKLISQVTFIKSRNEEVMEWG